MTWRPWLIASLLIAVFITNTILLVTETVQTPETAAEMVDEVKDPLANIPFTASQRLSNFKAFGLPDEMAEKAGDEAARIVKRKDRLAEILKENADVVGVPLCAGGELPQRYAALAFLVNEKDGEKAVVAWDRIAEFEVADWWADSLAPMIYYDLEKVADRKPDATAMGIAAILAGQEAAVIDGTSPWGKGITSRWSLTKVFKDYPATQRQLIEYFSLMHVLVEIANSKDGICE